MTLININKRMAIPNTKNQGTVTVGHDRIRKNQKETQKMCLCRDGSGGNEKKKFKLVREKAAHEYVLFVKRHTCASHSKRVPPHTQPLVLPFCTFGGSAVVVEVLAAVAPTPTAFAAISIVLFFLGSFVFCPFSFA